MDRLEKLLSELIALPSVNPAFLPAGDPQAGEQRVAEFLAATGAHMGLEVEFQPVLPGRSNVLLRLPPRGSLRQRVLLAPHMDTVGGEPISETLFQPRKKNGRLYGRGACDTKGSVTAMLTALGDLANAPNRPAHTEVLLAALVDEENNQAGSRALAASGLKADLAIIGEPTRLQVVTAHKGSLWLRLETRGQSAHGSRPELGRNAVHTMARIVNLLETRYAATLRRRRHSLLRPPTVSVGTISGGVQTNMVPARCAITVDRRTLPGETLASVLREMRQLLRQNGLVATLSDAKPAPCPPLETNLNKPVVRQFLHTMGSSSPLGVDFFCDAAVLAHQGIPSVVYGPGDIAQAHTVNEWLSLPALEKATQKLLQFLRALP